MWMELEAYVSSMASQMELSNTGKRSSIRNPKKPKNPYRPQKWVFGRENSWKDPKGEKYHSRKRKYIGFRRPHKPQNNDLRPNPTKWIPNRNQE